MSSGAGEVNGDDVVFYFLIIVQFLPYAFEVCRTGCRSGWGEGGVFFGLGIICFEKY